MKPALSMIIWLSCIFALLFQQADTFRSLKIAVTSGKWKTLLQNSIDLTKDPTKPNVILSILPEISNETFYDGITRIHRFLKNEKFDVVVGDSSLIVAQAVASYHLAFFSLDSKMQLQTGTAKEKLSHFYSVPYPVQTFSKSIVDLVAHFAVNRVALFIDETIDYQNFLQVFFEEKKLFVQVWTISNSDKEYPIKHYRRVKEILEDIRLKEFDTLVIFTDVNTKDIVIQNGKLLGMLSVPTKWIFPGVVCENIGLRAIKYIYTNITFISEKCSEAIMNNDLKIDTDQATVNVFWEIAQSVHYNLNLANLKIKLLDDPTYRWHFTANGLRGNARLEYNINSRQRNRLIKNVGYWTKSHYNTVFKFNLDGAEFLNSSDQRLFKRHFRIVGIEEHPHLIVKENSSFIGFGVDLIEYLSKAMNFTYKIYLVKQYGSKHGDKWNGMMGELIESRADITLGPLVQSREREDIIDFTTTFKQREISLVMRAPEEKTSYLQFLRPFGYKIWICWILTAIACMILMWILEFLTLKINPDIDHTDFNFKESSWFVSATMVAGGAEIVPRTCPSRIITWTIYLFSLIMISSYTANLAAFLTVKAYANKIQSYQDLAKLQEDKTDITFGTVKDSGVLDFFKHSSLPDFQKIYSIINRNPEWLVNSTEQGYKRSMNENYVFIWDDSVNQYEIFSEPIYKCALRIIGRPFGKRSFAIGMPQGAVYRERLDRALLNIVEQGILEKLEHKWWTARSICSTTKKKKGVYSKALSLSDVAGVFIVVILGIFSSFACLGIQALRFFSTKQRHAQNNKLNETEVEFMEKLNDQSNSHEKSGVMNVVQNDIRSTDSQTQTRSPGNDAKFSTSSGFDEKSYLRSSPSRPFGITYKDICMPKKFDLLPAYKRSLLVANSNFEKNYQAEIVNNLQDNRHVDEHSQQKKFPNSWHQNKDPAMSNAKKKQQFPKRALSENSSIVTTSFTVDEQMLDSNSEAATVTRREPISQSSLGCFSPLPTVSDSISIHM